MLKFFEKKKKVEPKPQEKWSCKPSPHDDQDLFWDEYGVYKKVYVNRFNKNKGE
ncbi:hypothetical protein [Clostridium scatologenes]|uniref:Uncharacterized protein n=1 Tax=Clostridium scatologenes TaxID=1548 RepID=A0A0E3K3V4_CLOSL|nr:hypothetical protein [Clostridium scatologenes]AKA71952.1 hypothetical protein CSCA_4827 [Clostridium scatologenes]